MSDEKNVEKVEVGKYEAAYLQSVHDESQRMASEAKQRLIAAIEEVRKDVGAPSEFVYDGYAKAFVPTPVEPQAVPDFEAPAPEPEGV